MRIIQADTTEPDRDAAERALHVLLTLGGEPLVDAFLAQHDGEPDRAWQRIAALVEYLDSGVA